MNLTVVPRSNVHRQHVSDTPVSNWIIMMDREGLGTKLSTPRGVTRACEDPVCGCTYKDTPC